MAAINGGEILLKIICQHEGALNYEDIQDLASGLLLRDRVDLILETNSDLFTVVVSNGRKRVIAKTSVRRCNFQDCTTLDCKLLHLCKFDLFGNCRRGRRNHCPYNHDMNSEHNSKILSENALDILSDQEIKQLLLQNDNSLLPQVCFHYNKGNGTYGNCHNKENCRMLHVCDGYINGTCSTNASCIRCHDFNEPHPRQVLQQRGVPDSLMVSMMSIYRNIQALKKGGQTGGNKNHGASVDDAVKDEICLFFVKGDCKQGDRCWRVHSKMPYKWQVKKLQTWTDLADNEAIERAYCDPNKTESDGVDKVCFDSMTSGHQEVRRLSTVSHLAQPSFVLTTKWLWYWEDEYGQWIRYGSVNTKNTASSIDYETLEQKYREDPAGTVQFDAGKQSYELSFREMMQKNTIYGTEKRVQRRPEFVSSADAQTARTRRNGPRNTSRNPRGLPGYWDKSAIPEEGYKAVTLLDSDRDYQKVQERFRKTMSGFNIVSIQRIQNPDLWEDFQKKRDRMKKNNGGKDAREQLLFHGTDSKYVDSICKDNFDWRRCGKNGTVYGEGSYFARDAKYSHNYTSDSCPRTMFVCRVLVGDYTCGYSGLRLPPQKEDGSSAAYDSCVDSVIKPSIYVVFDRVQAYPEFIVKYNDGFTQMPSATLTNVISYSGPSIYMGSSQSSAPTLTKPASVSVQYPSASSPSHAVNKTPASSSMVQTVQTSAVKTAITPTVTPVRHTAIPTTPSATNRPSASSGTIAPSTTSISPLANLSPGSTSNLMSSSVYGHSSQGGLSHSSSSTSTTSDILHYRRMMRESNRVQSQAQSKENCTIL